MGMSIVETYVMDTLCNKKLSFLSFLVLNFIVNMCLFVEKKEKSVVFSVTYKY